MVRYPLVASGELVGLLLLFDLPGLDRIAEINQIIHLLSPTIALSLKNALAFRQIEQQALKLEERVEQRTAELRQKNAELQQSDDRHRSILQTAMDGIWLVDTGGRLLDVNDRYCQMSGYSQQELLTMSVPDLEGIESESSGDTAAHFQKVIALGEDRFESRHRRKDGTVYDVEISVQYQPIDEGQFLAFLHDITDRKQMERFKDMSRDILQLLNTSDDLKDSVQKVLTLLKTRVGVEAVGLRLQEGDDYSYFYEDRFPKDLLLKENSPIEHAADMGGGWDKDGNICLECTCGLVITGKIEQRHPFLTPGGSFWTNDSFPRPDLPAGVAPRNHPPNECIHHNCASVALVPIRDNKSIVGLIQFNDQRKNRFTLKSVQLLEDIASHIGAALMRKKTEEKLRRSEHRLAEAERIGNTGSWDYEVASDTSAWSENMFRILDVDPLLPKELVFKYFVENLVHPGDVKHVSSAFQNALSDKSPYDVEYRVVKMDGSISNIHAIAENIYDEQGKVTRLIGRIEDITEKVRSEEALRLTRFSVEHASDALFWITPDGHVVDVNEAACRSLGYSRAELLQLTITDIDPLQTAETWQQHFEELRQQGSLTFESEHSTKDGKLIPVEIVANHVKFGDEEHNCAFVRNIADRKRAEEERAMLESQLHQAQKMESVGSLAGGIAHDFNNKLTVIIGHTCLALTEPDLDKIHGNLVQIRKAAEQSADLTRQLLAFARKQTIAPKVLDLNETLASMLKMLQRLIGEDSCLTWKPAPDLWQLKFDPSQIDQILANLCVNARDAISVDGKITIETGNSTIDENYCAHHADVLPGEYVRLVVSDNGCGMSKETLDRIFEPFFTTKETGKGTGLGLATVFGIVKQNNGFINVYSEPGIGTTFTIYFPRHAGESMPVQKDGTAESAPRGKETIMVVEDELAILDMISSMLTSQGYRVLQANTPAEAMRLAKKYISEIRLLITDVIMPAMNGKDLANNLQPLNPRLKYLFISGYTADAIAQHGVLDEGVNFIQKPFSLLALASKVREILDSEQDHERNNAICT